MQPGPGPRIQSGSRSRSALERGTTGTDRQSGRPSARLPLWPLAVLVGCALAIATRDHGPGGESVAWLASGIVCVALIPAALHARAQLLGRSVGGPIPFMPLIGCIYAAYYGLPSLLSDQPAGIGHVVSPESLARGSALGLLGVTALVAGYCLLGPRVPVGRPLRLDWDPARARAFAIFMLPVGFVAQLALRTLELPSALIRPVDLIGMFLPLSAGVIIFLGRSGQAPRALVRLVWCVVLPAYLVFEAGDGYVGSAVRIAIFVAMLIWGLGRRIPIAAILIGVVLLATLRAGGHEYRRFQESGATDGASVVEQVQEVGGLAYTAWREQGPAELTASIVERVAQIVVLAGVAERTPVSVPFWRGHTYASIPASVIPRAIWPGKPSKNLGQEFGHRYAYLDPNDFKTSINLPQLVECYVNFGRLGVLLGMLAIGVFYRRIEAVLNHPRATDAATVAGAMVLSTLANIESDASMVFGECLQVMVVLFVASRFVRRPAAAPQGFRSGLRLAGRTS